MWLTDLTSALQKAKVRYGLVGGYAVALHGAVRGTLDIDFVLPLEEQSYVRAEKVLQSLGLKSRIPVTATEVFRFRNEYIAKRNLIAWSFSHPNEPRKIVDVIITHDLRKMKTERVMVESTPVTIVSIKDLIAMKKASGRTQDLADIAALRRLR